MALLALNLLLAAVRPENVGVVQLTYQIGLDAVDVDPPQRSTLSGFFLRQLPFLAMWASWLILAITSSIFIENLTHSGG